MDEENEKVHSAYREEMNRCYRIKMSGSAHLLKALINSIRGKKNSTENANLVWYLLQLCIQMKTILNMYSKTDF